MLVLSSDIWEDPTVVHGEPAICAYECVGIKHDIKDAVIAIIDMRIETSIVANRCLGHYRDLLLTDR